MLITAPPIILLHLSRCSVLGLRDLVGYPVRRRRETWLQAVTRSHRGSTRESCGLPAAITCSVRGALWLERVARGAWHPWTAPSTLGRYGLRAPGQRRRIE